MKERGLLVDEVSKLRAQEDTLVLNTIRLLLIIKYSQILCFDAHLTLYLLTHYTIHVYFPRHPLYKVTILDDLKATSGLEKSAIKAEKDHFESQAKQLQSDKDNIAVNMFELEERLQEVIEDRQAVTKEKASLLTRILFLGEQRSSLIREAEERDKRDVEQVATIAGEQQHFMREEWH